MDVAYLARTNETTKGTILEVLSSEWPLSIKKIYLKLKKKRRKALTYQAAYKSVKELLGEGVLSRQDSEYMISPIWIDKSTEFVNKLAEDYEKSGFGTARKIQELNFPSFDEAWNFMLSKIGTSFFGESKQAYVQLRRFFLVPLSKEDISTLKSFFLKKEVYVMCRANSPIDKIMASFLSSMGAHVITGIECARPTSVFVYGNSVVNFYVTDEKERAKLTEFYRHTKDMEPPKAHVLKSFSNLFHNGMRVKLIITRDPGVLNDVVEQTRAILSKKAY